MSFDLVSRPWLPVVDLDGGTDVVSLRRLLLDARRLRRIAGETPPMTAALYRLVLAVIHRAYQPSDQDAWATLWKAGDLPARPLEEYFEKHQDRFDLFHPERPFFQCPAVSSSGKSGPAKLIAYRAVGNNATLFDHTTAADKVVLEPAEAARWLVTLQAYDPGGLKTPYKKSKSSERAPCSWFGVCLVEGRDLKETLLLNTLPYAPGNDLPRTTTSADDRPVWEDPELTDPEPATRSPYGWTDVLTWPSRRVWLSTTESDSGTVVDQVVITPGTALRGDLPDAELMAAYHRPTTASGKPKLNAPLLPVRLHPIRGVWRHSVELLLASTRDRQRPDALKWIAEGVEDEHIPGDTVYTLRVFGQQLDTKGGGSVESWLEEAIPAPVALLRAESSRVGRIIGAAIKLATGAGDALRRLDEGHRNEFNALKQLKLEQRMTLAADLDLAYWPRLSDPFGVFLRSLGEALHNEQPESKPVEAWERAVWRIARRAADQWAAASPQRGRSLQSIGKQHVDFTRQLDKLVKTFRQETAASVIREGAA